MKVFRSDARSQIARLLRSRKSGEELSEEPAGGDERSREKAFSPASSFLDNKKDPVCTGSNLFVCCLGEHCSFFASQHIAAKGDRKGRQRAWQQSNFGTSLRKLRSFGNHSAAGFSSRGTGTCARGS